MSKEPGLCRPSQRFGTPTFAVGAVQGALRYLGHAHSLRKGQGRRHALVKRQGARGGSRRSRRSRREQRGSRGSPAHRRQHVSLRQDAHVGAAARAGHSTPSATSGLSAEPAVVCRALGAPERRPCHHRRVRLRLRHLRPRRCASRVAPEAHGPTQRSTHARGYSSSCPGCGLSSRKLKLESRRVSPSSLFLLDRALLQESHRLVHCSSGCVSKRSPSIRCVTLPAYTTGALLALRLNLRSQKRVHRQRSDSGPTRGGHGGGSTVIDLSRST